MCVKNNRSCRQVRGRPRSPSGKLLGELIPDLVSRNQAIVLSLKPLSGSRFCERMKLEENFIGSRRKKIGVLLPTMSKLPSSE